MKTTIILILTMLLVILITSTYQPSEEILVLGSYNNEKKAITEFSQNDIRLIDIVNDINNNKTKKINNKEVTIQNALIKVKQVVINHQTIENARDLENVFKLVRRYCKEQVVLNTKTKTNLIVNLCNKNEITCNFLLQ